MRKRFDELIRLAAQGLTDKEIAASLGLKLNTVESYWKEILEQLGAPSRTAAAIQYLTSKVEESNRSLHEAHSLLENALATTRQTLSKVIDDTQRRIRVAKEREDLFGLFERACQCSSAFAYEVIPSDPFKCRFISPSAALFGIDVDAIRLNKTNFWGCVYEEDVSPLWALTQNTPYQKGIRCVYTYRLQTPEPRWIIDSHQCLYNEKDRLTGFAGIVVDAQALVDAGLLVASVRRLEHPGHILEPYTPSEGSCSSINPL